MYTRNALTAPFVKDICDKNSYFYDCVLDENLRDDPQFLFHFLNVYDDMTHFGKFQEHFNSRSKMAHLPLKERF